MVLPPFTLEAEQTLIDGCDKNLTVCVKQFGSTEISVKVQPPGRNPPQFVKVPPRGEAVVDFDPTGLPLGRHELTAEGTDATGVPFSLKVAFIRITGPFDR